MRWGGAKVRGYAGVTITDERNRPILTSLLYIATGNRTPTSRTTSERLITTRLTGSVPLGGMVWGGVGDI